MRIRRFIILLAQILTVVVLAIGIFTINKKQIDPVTVYQFTGDIKANTTVSSEDFKAITVPKPAVTSDFILKETDLQDYFVDEETGKVSEYVVSTDVFEGQYVTKQLLVPSEKRDLLKGMDLSDYRQMVIPVNLRTGVAGWIEPGELVDLVYLAKGTSQNGGAFTYSKLFMQEVLVNEIVTGSGYPYVSVYSDEYDSMMNSWDGKVETQPTENSSEMAYLVVTVTTEQALELEARMSTGQITALRRFEDSQKQNINDYIIGEQGQIKTGQGVVEPK